MKLKMRAGVDASQTHTKPDWHCDLCGCDTKHHRLPLPSVYLRGFEDSLLPRRSWSNMLHRFKLVKLARKALQGRQQRADYPRMSDGPPHDVTQGRLRMFLESIFMLPAGCLPHTDHLPPGPRSIHEEC